MGSRELAQVFSERPQVVADAVTTRQRAEWIIRNLVVFFRFFIELLQSTVYGCTFSARR